MTWKSFAVFVTVGVVLLFSGFVWQASHQADLSAARKDTEILRLKNEVRSLQSKVETLQDQLNDLESRVKRLSMTASWYGPGFHGRKASDGSIFSQFEFTCAHRTLPLGTILVIEYNGKRVPAIVTDRGPFINGRDIDLSMSLAKKLGFVDQGVVKVTVYQWRMS